MVIKKRHQVRFLGGAVIRLSSARYKSHYGSWVGWNGGKNFIGVSKGWSTGRWIFCQLSRFAQSGTRYKNHLSFLKRIRIFPASFSIHGQEGKGWQIHLAWNGTRVSENQRKIPVWENQNRIRTKQSVYIVKESDCLERITLYHS